MDVGENEEMAMGAEVLARGRGIRITPANGNNPFKKDEMAY